MKFKKLTPQEFLRLSSQEQEKYLDAVDKNQIKEDIVRWREGRMGNNTNKKEEHKT